jgi:fluoroquinolone transport system permease protein
MNMRPIVQRLARNDVRLILRDPMLVMLLSLAAVIGVVGRYALRAIDLSLLENGLLPNPNADFRFASTFPMFVTFIALWQGALMPGTVFGFLLLDEKEDDTLTALRVTPVRLEQYLAYRVALPAALAFLFSLALAPLIGHAPIPLWQLAPTTCDSDALCAIARASRVENRTMESWPFDRVTTTSSSGWATGNGRNSSWSSRLKMAVLAPIASASDKTAVTAKPGVRTSQRHAWRRSATTSSRSRTARG